MLEEKWVSIPLENVDMEKLNLNFFYQLGSHLTPLTNVATMPDEFCEWDIVHHSRGAKSSIKRLIAAYPELSVCKSAAPDFLEHLDYYIKWHDKRLAEGDREKVTSGNTAFFLLEERAKAFESVLLAELQNLGAFHITGKRAYDTLKLIDHFEETLSAATLSKINKKIVEEINQSGRCLAFDCYTACGFHILRATEAVLHQYYIVVCKPESQAPLDSWSAYISALHKIEEHDVKKVVALLQPIKHIDRNRIMHPEWVLTQDEAIDVFDSAKAAIEMMAKRLP
jgi:hypothetical protein